MSDVQANTDQSPGEEATRWAFGLAGLFAVLAGVLVFGAFAKLAFPFLLANWGMASFGRIWPMATLTLVFGAITFAHIGTTYHLTPRLTGVDLGGSTERFGPMITGVLVGIGILSVGLGFGDGRAGFETGLLADLALVLALLGPAVYILRSTLKKEEATIYPTIWYLAGGLVTALAAVVVANFPISEATGSFVQTAFGRGAILWGWAVAGGVGAAFYLVPKITGRPLFSRQLAVVTFFSLLVPGLFYGLSTHLFGPIPDWAEAIGVGMRFTLVVPAVAIPVGLILSGEGRLDLLRHNVVLRLVAAGAGLVSVGALISGLTAFPGIQSAVGLTTFDMGTEFLVLSGALLLSSAMAVHAWPSAVGASRAYSDDSAEWHMRLTVIGAVSSAVVLWIAGIAAGSSMRAGAATGAFANYGEGFAETLDSVSLLYVLLPVTGLVFMMGQFVLGRHLWASHRHADELGESLDAASDTVDEPVEGEGVSA